MNVLESAMVKCQSVSPKSMIHSVGNPDSEFISSAPPTVEYEFVVPMSVYASASPSWTEGDSDHMASQWVNGFGMAMSKKLTVEQSHNADAMLSKLLKKAKDALKPPGSTPEPGKKVPVTRWTTIDLESSLEEKE